MTLQRQVDLYPFDPRSSNTRVRLQVLAANPVGSSGPVPFHPVGLSLEEM